jgi:hypothetical protein
MRGADKPYNPTAIAPLGEPLSRNEFLTDDLADRLFNTPKEQTTKRKVNRAKGTIRYSLGETQKM